MVCDVLCYRLDGGLVGSVVAAVGFGVDAWIVGCWMFSVAVGLLRACCLLVFD